MWVEGLERRTLMTATVANGLLTINGTADHDTIEVRLSRNGHTLTVIEALPSTWNWDVAAGFPDPLGPTTTTRFDLDATPVTSILIHGRDGNDKVSLFGSRTRPIDIPAEIFGDDGMDRLRGGAGGDRLYGGNDADQLIGGAGDDALFGGDGNDELVGGLGADTLSGEAGNDLLDAIDGGGRDVIGGGTENAGEEWRLFGRRPLDHAIVDRTEGHVRGVEFVEVLRRRPPAKIVLA